MSRIANSPVVLPKGVDVTLAGKSLTVKGAKGSLSLDVHPEVILTSEDGKLLVKATNLSNKFSHAMSGTTRALVNNMVIGVSEGFSKKLQLVGVGYRAQMQGDLLNLTLGFSHPVQYAIPEGIKIETPTQTEILVSGIDKQRVGQVAAEIRAYRSPEPYKGKGVKYSNEIIRRKEAKKK
jgi:large subunit ribosomal protein L6